MLSIQCVKSGIILPSAPGAIRPGEAPSLFDGTGTGFGAADRFQRGNTSYHALKAVSGTLEAHVLSYSIYSPVRARISLLDSSGSYVSATAYDNVYSGSSGFVNYDTALVARNLPAGDYYLQVTSSRLDSAYYPGGEIPLDDVPFVVITGSINEGSPPLAGAIPANGRCALTENFASYSSPPGDPPRTSLREDDEVGFCGSIREAGGGDANPPASAIIGWFLPYILMLIAFQIRFHRPRFGTCAPSG
jgi:hypothetical protein